MPKNKVSDPITDQEIAFARLVLSGTMTDRRAAEAVGMNPNSAAYTKAKPRVRAYMLEHRAAVQQQLVQQEGEELHRLKLDREQVLARLWEIANLNPEMTRGSITGQVKALSMIIAMQSFIPDRVPALTEKNPIASPNPPQIYVSAWRAAQQSGATPAPQTPPTAVPEPARVPAPQESEPPADGQSHPAHLNPSQPQPPASVVPLLTSVPDARAHFLPTKNPFARRR